MTTADRDILQEGARFEALRRTCLLDSRPEEAFDRLTRMATTVLRVPVSMVSFVDQDRLVIKSQRGLAEPLASTRVFPLSLSFCRQAVVSKQPVVVNDARQHPDFSSLPAVTQYGLVSYAGIPLVTPDGHALGTFCVLDRHPHDWSEEEIGILRVLATCAMSELDLRSLVGELSHVTANLQKLVDDRTSALRATEERQRVLLDVNNAIVTCLDRESLFLATVAALRPLIPFERASLVLLDPVKNVFKVLGVAGPVPSPAIIPLGFEWPRQGSRTGWVVDHCKPMLSRDFLEETPFVEYPLLLEEGLRSAISVPLMNKGKARGTLNVASRTPGRYGENEASLMTAIGEQVALALENMLAYEEIAALKARLQDENLYLQEEARSELAFGDIVGESPAILRVLADVRKVAGTDSTVLVTGETGTGKEMIVRAVHSMSRRKSKLMVKVNCAALPAGVIESELFGHEKGAFTGALTRKIGRFELAHGGTLFLDEVGDLPLELQAKLLRVLQEGEFERVGGTQTVHVDVRVVAATNRDLERAVAEGKFRADLYYRLHVFPVVIPPLRSRAQDIPRLARHFVMHYASKMGKQVGPLGQDVIERLTSYAWPGNVRELQNVIERAVILSPRGRFVLGDLAGGPAVGPDERSEARTLEDVERRHILGVLEQTGWRVSGDRGAAGILGLKRTTLEARMKKLGIQRRH
jgi:formate hydrogenlyase transcriptional activator